MSYYSSLLIGAMSFRLSIPWRVALQQSSPPLPQLCLCSNQQPRSSSKTQRTATGEFPFCLNQRGHSIPDQGIKFPDTPY